VSSPGGGLGAVGQTAPLTAATPFGLADQARYGAWLLRTRGTTSATTEPGTYVGAGHLCIGRSGRRRVTG
jgi:hypothetical protein